MPYYDHTFTPWRVRDGNIILASDKTWKKPLKWNRDASFLGDMGEGPRPRVLCEPPVDVFGEWDGPLVFSGREPVYVGRDFRAAGGFSPRATFDDLRRRLLRLIDGTPHLDWIMPTGMPENVAAMMPRETVVDVTACYEGGRPASSSLPRTLYNLWLGVTIRTQADAERLIPPLLKCRDCSGKLFVRARPMEELALRRWLCDAEEQYQSCRTPAGIDWLIVEGDKEPMHPNWVRSLREQATAAGVPFWFEGWGEWLPHDPGVRVEGGLCRASRYFPHVRLCADGAIFNPNSTAAIRSPAGSASLYRVGKKAAGRLIDGREWSEVPR